MHGGDYGAAMAKAEQPAKKLIGQEGHLAYATWSRAGRNLILTVAADERWSENQQVLLTQQQAAELAEFFLSGPRTD